MRIRATCHACQRDFLFFELRNAEPLTADRCPNCGHFLGVRGLEAVRVEQALAVLVGSMEELARRQPNFTIRASSVLRPVEEAVTSLAAPPVLDLEDAQRKSWWKRLRAAA